MTLKKSKKGQAKGQAIFEYFILTTVVVAVVLFFANTPYFQGIKNSCTNAFDRAVSSILGQEDSVASPGSPGGSSSDTGGSPGGPTTTMTLTSPAFEDGKFIPPKYTGDGEDVNPTLSIGAVPEGTKSLALIVDDPDAPVGTWVHWIVYDIPVVDKIIENSIPGKQGINDFGSNNYEGPAPPAGEPHHYHFKIYALDTMINLPEGIGKDQLVKAMQGHILGQVELVGLYKR